MEAIGFEQFCIKGGYQESSHIVHLHELKIILLQGHGKMAVEVDFGRMDQTDILRLGVRPQGMKAK